MPENRGRMLPNSLMNMMIDSIRAMDLAILKIKQVIAKAAPDGYIIDVDALQEIDLGNGLLNPLQIKDIKQQTGDLYYRGKREDGSDNQIPIRDSISQFETKIQAFINNYNFELSNIRQYLGVNEFRDGSASSARIGFRFMQAQAQASNTITWFIYQAYLSSAQELMRHAGIRIWDALISDNVNEGYARYLGNKNIEWIKAKKDITSSSYDIKFSMGISEDDKTILQEYINTCLGQGSLQMPDALMINRIKDPMVAEKMLSYLFKKRSKERDRIALEQQTAQAKAQEQMGVAVERAKQESIKLQITSDYEKAKAKGEQDRDLAMKQYAYKFMEIALTQGIQLPPEYQAIVEGVIQNRGLSVVMETQEKEGVFEQQAIHEEQAMTEQELAAYSEELQRRVGNID